MPQQGLNSCVRSTGPSISCAAQVQLPFHLAAQLCRLHLRDADLLRLAPRQQWRQRSHALLMGGTLHSMPGMHSSRGSGLLNPSGGGSAERCGSEVLQAPAVLPWLAPHLGLPASGSHGLVAGSSGSLLLVCPEEPASPSSLSSRSSGRSMSELGPSPFADASRGVQEQGGQERSVPSAPSRHAAPAEAEPERLPPSGRPLHRVKSRR